MWRPNSDLDLCKVNCIFIKNIFKNWQFVPNQHIQLIKYHYSVQTLDGIFIKIFLMTFIFIHVGIHKILFLFTWGSTRFYFYSHGDPQDFISIHVGIHEILFLFMWGSTRFYFYSHGDPRDFISIPVGIHEILFLAPKSLKTTAVSNPRPMC